MPNNYRPTSLTCISCKIMEHILCSHLSDHLEINNILTPHQHGFRKGFSTETLDDWLSSLDKRIRTDVLLIDFSKAFDSVPHQRLLLKLNYYGITGNSPFWIKYFLLDRTQCVQVSGTRSSWISVTSDVPQGRVLGPLLFLIYINDIVHNLNSKIKLFADDAVLYSEVSNVDDVSLFQQDLDTLSRWAATWQMNFNLVKCNNMSITRSPLKFPAGYKLRNSPLESISCHRYLGVFIQDKLEWDSCKICETQSYENTGSTT